MLPNWYNEYKTMIDFSINKYLIDYFKSEKNPALDLIKEATLYSVKGGKRIRSILALEFYLILSNKDFGDISYKDDIIKFCIGIELLHAYSLVHDDLPCMDNDEYRRGNLTTWKKYTELYGVLVGDLLNSLAFEVISETKSTDLIKKFGKSVGIKGMLGGQVLDLYYEENPHKLSKDNLNEIHNKKTGALIEISIIGGILLTNLTRDEKNIAIKKYSSFGKKIGLAFQIKDDLLDVEGTFEETGKSVGGEEKGYVFFNGLEKSKQDLNKNLVECKSIINGLNAEKIYFIIEYIGNRIK